MVREIGGEREGQCGREGWWGSKVMGERHSLGNRGGGGEGQGESGREVRWERGVGERGVGGERQWERRVVGKRGSGCGGKWGWGSGGSGE